LDHSWVHQSIEGFEFWFTTPYLEKARASEEALRLTVETARGVINDGT